MFCRYQEVFDVPPDSAHEAKSGYAFRISVFSSGCFHVVGMCRAHGRFREVLYQRPAAAFDVSWTVPSNEASASDVLAGK